MWGQAHSGHEEVVCRTGKYVLFKRRHDLKKIAFPIVTQKMRPFLYSLKQSERFRGGHQIQLLGRKVVKEGLLFPIAYAQVLFKIFIIDMRCFYKQKRNEGIRFVENGKWGSGALH